jgi:hypothetical protein
MKISNMKRHILMVLGLLCFGLLVVTIAAPNIGGSWVRDNAKSDPVPDPIMLNRPTTPQGGGGARGGAGGRGNSEAVMTVQQEGNALVVTSPQGSVSKYTLDGKPYTTATETGIEKAVITANWQGDTLVIGTTQPYGGMPGNVTLQMKEVWSLSPDGKVLTITTTRTIPAVEKTYKQVYNKK